MFGYLKKMWKKENKFSYFAKWDEVSGVSACPGCKSLPTLDNSCYDPNYRDIFAKILKHVKPGEDPLCIGDPYEWKMHKKKVKTKK